MQKHQPRGNQNTRNHARSAGDADAKSARPDEQEIRDPGGVHANRLGKRCRQHQRGGSHCEHFAGRKRAPHPQPAGTGFVAVDFAIDS